MHFRGTGNVEGTPVDSVLYEPLAWKYLSIVLKCKISSLTTCPNAVSTPLGRGELV